MPDTLAPAPTTPAAAPPTAWEQYRPQLAAYASARVNYDHELVNERTAPSGWHHDQYSTVLPPEAPGPPAPDGSFAAARDVLWHYAFPPPNLIKGYFDPSQPLAQRIMLLHAHFLGFNFRFGVRIVDVVDETLPPPPGAAGPAQVWGYGYRTLEGHFEMGQINFAVHKNLLTGEVQFRVASVSRRGRIGNPVYWLGFVLFGRLLQKYFARQSLRRMRKLVAGRLAAGQTMAPARG